MRYYTGIGSRNTPWEICMLMSAIAKKYANAGWVLRSGGAEGADTAFENGAVIAHGKQEIYIPWEGFNQHYSGRTSLLVTDKLTLESADKLAAEVHPAWDRCSPAAKKLHIRNTFQVLGINLLRPSSLLICWAPIQGDSIKGGTRTAWEIAKLYDIPRFNLADPGTEQKFRLFVARSRSLRER